MVNSKNLLSAGVLALAFAAIITYMNANGLTTEDITFVDACYRSAQAKGINQHTCEAMERQNYKWDTQVPCVKGFKEEMYFYTPRMMFTYLAGGKTDIAKLGRTNKGSEEVVYDAKMNLTYAEALMDRCSPAFADGEYPIFQELFAQYSSGVALEDLDTSVFTDRALYGWSTVKKWINKAIGAIGKLWKKSSQSLVNSANYRACSVGLALAWLAPGLVDTAECSGNHPTQCYRYHSNHYNNRPYSGWWTNRRRGNNNRLNNGCVTHDQCLNNNVKNGKQCDADLSAAGKKCVQWKWPGISCGWRGCHWWWFSWAHSCGDARFTSGCVWLSMATHPNKNKIV